MKCIMEISKRTKEEMSENRSFGTDPNSSPAKEVFILIVSPSKITVN